MNFCSYASRACMPKLAVLHCHLTATLCCWQGAARSHRWQGESQAAPARRAVERRRKGIWLRRCSGSKQLQVQTDHAEHSGVYISMALNKHRRSQTCTVACVRSLRGFEGGPNIQYSSAPEVHTGGFKTVAVSIRAIGDL